MINLSLIGVGRLVSRLLILLAVLLLQLPGSLLAQEEAKGEEHIGLPTDWSQRHMVFSAPGSSTEALNLSGNPRYVQQWLRRNIERRHRIHRAHRGIHRDWSENLGTGAAVGAGQYPAKYSYNATVDSCANDFVVFNTGLAGATGQASIIAYNNLYVGCTGTVPAVYWAYDTGGTISTSVTLSLDGKQLAFVQAQGGVATLVLLKWTASTTESVTAPMLLTGVANSSYRSCTAPCMTTISFHATTTTDPTPVDSNSSPYYDFTPGSDTLYVGDNAGYLHQFTGVFAGTPAETTTTWPVEAAAAPLSSPIYDPVTGNVFVTTSFQTSDNSGGRLQTVCATSTCVGINNGNATTALGTATPSGILGPDTTGTGNCRGTGASGNGSNLRLDAPIVDSTAGKVYVFLGNDGGGNSVVIQFPTKVSATSFHSCPAETTVGTGSTTGIPLFAGTFDNLYFTSDGGDTPSGSLYVCGNTSGDATLYQVPITSDAIAASGTSVLAVSTGNTTCSPLTEAYNAGTDLIFLSVESLGSTSSAVNCPSNAGCLMSFSVPTTLGGTLPATTKATLAASGGTSGVVIDNTVAPGTLHTSQVYFSTLTGGTAVQASQAALK
ncbi:MAG: hypothetical protein WBQ08_17520 [Candidatus Sulfotelmatobacter sp.]